jgi:hypothetical protein
LVFRRIYHQASMPSMEEIVRHIRVFVLALQVAAAAAFAQDTPTGVVKSGGIALLRTESMIAVGSAPAVESTTDNFTAGFQSIDYSNYTPPAPQVTTIGPCVVAVIGPPSTTTGPLPSFLDAGPVINLSGPNGMKQIPVTKNVYFAMLGGGIPLPFPIPGLPGPTPLWLDPGTYTVDNGGGGADVGPFTVTLAVPAPAFVWTNADANLTIDRSAGVDIQWVGGDPANNVNIQGAVAILDPVTHQTAGGGSFTCSVPNTGDFVITPDVLAVLPATPAGIGPTTGISTLSVGTQSRTSFTASGIDQGVFTYTAGAARNVVYQ